MKAPRGHWLLGHIPHFRSNPIEFLNACDGDVISLRLGRTALLLLHPDDVTHVLETSEQRYSKGRAFQYGRQLYGNSLLTSEGEDHRRQLQGIGGVFLKNAADSFLTPAEPVTQQWIQRWKSQPTFDLWRALSELTAAISIHAVFGSDFIPAWLNGAASLSGTATRMTNANSSAAQQFLEDFDTAMDYVATRNFAIINPPEWFPTAKNRAYKAAISRLNLAFQHAVNRRLEGTSHGGFLSELLELHQRDPVRIPMQQVRDQSLILMLGGYESSATALCWCLLLLSRATPIREELKTACRSTIATDSVSSNSERPALAAETLISEVFSESLRLYPPPWLIPRTCIEDDQLPTGQSVQKGTQIFLSPYRTHRDARWFDSPDDFRPQRFSSKRSAQFRRGSYFPFGLGTRHCIGESIARSQAVKILKTIYSQCDIEFMAKEWPKTKPLLTLRPESPVFAKIVDS